MSKRMKILLLVQAFSFYSKNKYLRGRKNE